MTGEPTHTTSKGRNDTTSPSYINEKYAHMKINNSLKSTSAIKAATMKITDDFFYERNCTYHQVNTFRCEQR